jgi:hypothetical protein
MASPACAPKNAGAPSSEFRLDRVLAGLPEFKTGW